MAYETTNEDIDGLAPVTLNDTKGNDSIIDDEHPLVSFAVPCYNSEDFIARCVNSLLTAQHPCEILLVNDGSTDNTSQIIHEYAEKYPQVIAIDQENRNWGGVVNHALRKAKGVYFKVVDSDDFLDTNALQKVLDTLSLTVKTDQAPDLFITNYVYDRITDNSQHTIDYRKLFPAGRLITWNDMSKHSGIDQFIMIHASWYRTAILRESELTLPEGVSYMDSLFVLHPMLFVKTLFYLDVDAYHYLIGRAGQSVEIDVVKRCIDQQLLASRLAIDDADYTAVFEQEPNQAKLMMGYISCMMAVSTIYLFKINTPEALEKNRKLWDYMEKTNPTLYKFVKRSWAGWANRKSAPMRAVAKAIYALAREIFKFA